MTPCQLSSALGRDQVELSVCEAAVQVIERRRAVLPTGHRLEQGGGGHSGAIRLRQHHQMRRLRRDRRLGTPTVFDDLQHEVEARSIPSFNRFLSSARLQV